jgi:hypothetical protein
MYCFRIIATLPLNRSEAQRAYITKIQWGVFTPFNDFIDEIKPIAIVSIEKRDWRIE